MRRRQIADEVDRASIAANQTDYVSYLERLVEVLEPHRRDAIVSSLLRSVDELRDLCLSGRCDHDAVRRLTRYVLRDFAAGRPLA